MDNLEVFLNGRAVRSEGSKYIASRRYKDADGNAVEWIIKPVSAGRNIDLKRECIREYGSAGAECNDLDYNLYLLKLCAECTVYPDLTDVKLRESYAVGSSEALLGDMLTSGEFERYAEEVLRVNDFKSDEELEERAKNL